MRAISFIAALRVAQSCAENRLRRLFLQMAYDYCCGVPVENAGGVVMKHIHAAMRLAAIAIVMTWAGAAPAKDLRYPDKGPIAFVLHIPDSWAVTPGDGYLNLVTADHSAVVSLVAAVDDANTAASTADEFANEALKIAKAEPFHTHKTTTLAGIPADVYYSRIVNAKNVHADIKMIVIKSVRNHTLSQSILTVAGIRADQTKALNAGLNGITVAGLK
jgi:hypothetical protein